MRRRYGQHAAAAFPNHQMSRRKTTTGLELHDYGKSTTLGSAKTGRDVPRRLRVLDSRSSGMWSNWRTSQYTTDDTRAALARHQATRRTCSPTPRRAAQHIQASARSRPRRGAGRGRKAQSDKICKSDFDGELQVDAALIPDIAVRKLPASKVAGRCERAHLSPNLNSGNIARQARASHWSRPRYGQILLGLVFSPAADVSRGFNHARYLGGPRLWGAQSISYAAALCRRRDEKLPGEK